MSSGDTKTSTQTTANSPWKPAIPYLKGSMEEAARLAEKNKGFGAYPEQAWTDYSAQTLSGLNTMEQLASAPNPFYQPNADFTSGLVAGAYNPNANAQYATGIASGAQGQTALAQYGTDIASGAQGITTEADYRDLYDNTNQYFNEALDTQSAALADDIARTFGGASFGSAASTGAVVDQVGDLRTQAMSDQYNTEMAFKAGLLGDISGVQGQNISNQLAAAGALSGEQGSNIDNQLAAAGQLSAEQQLGTQNQMAGVGMSDQVYQSQYLPSATMLGVGAAYDAKEAEKLQAQMSQYDIQQQQPWNLLGAAYPYFTGTGASTSTTTTEQPTDPWSTIVGGGLLASQMFLPGGVQL